MYNSFGKYKTTSRVQIFLGLFLACCFILCSSSHITKADNFYQYSWGSFDQSGTPFQIYNSTGLNVYDMLNYLYGEDNLSGRHPSYTPNVRFYDMIYSLGLEPAFTFFDTSAPPFYINLYHYGQGLTEGIFILFSKSSCFFNDESYSLVRNDSGNYIFSTGNPIVFYDSLNYEPNPITFYRTPLIINNTLLNNGDTCLVRMGSPGSGSFYESSSSFLSGGSLRSCKSYIGYFGTVQDVSMYFSEWMNSSFQFLTIDLNFYNGGTDPYHIYIGMDCIAGNNYAGSTFGNTEPSNRIPLISTIYTYALSSGYKFSYDFNYAFRIYNDGSNTYPIGAILSYGLDHRTMGNLPTPIPYPTQYWYTPTPFPTVILDPTLTPIGFFGDTDIVVNTGDLWGDIKGNLGIFNEWFATNPFPAFFAGTADLIYSFNPIFKFLMIIPITALIAMVIGRLRRK